MREKIKILLYTQWFINFTTQASLLGKKIQSTKKEFKIKEEFSKSITCYIQGDEKQSPLALIANSKLFLIMWL